VAAPQRNGPLPKRRGRGGAKRKPDRAQPQEEFGEISGLNILPN